MNYKKLGNTDIDVSTICLGTMTWGEQNTEVEGFEQMDYAFDKGINFWDTAEIYSIPPKEETYGYTEVIIGNWFKKSKKRDKVILASKVAGPMRSYVRGGGNNYGEKKITKALEESLKRLKTDYIDLYQLHWPERNTNYFGKFGYEHKKDENQWTAFEDILESLKKFIDQGKIRYIGISNETAWGLSKFLELSNQKNLPRVIAVQNPYNLLNRSYEVGLAEISIREKSGLLAYSPLAFGYLTGKYRNNKLPKGSRMDLFKDFTRYQNDNGLKAVEKYYKIAEKYNINLAQMSLKFVETQPFVTSVIIGATTMEQLKINVESVNLKLSDEIINEINEIQKIYPNPCP
ncbi:MAG: NADP(H)-dependent aldo-keto reductase [Candidatus Pelagibacter sp.]|nr:NADP(H)-dependent aldo-keto reductase [Candidatus Pelagibacter sp.]OUT95744.1 MAG: NADP(H)-dependent aldo-keto reductase [Gammaproteobacteria bacterium TMED36]